jgi:type I restriction enzyme S subunit
MPQNIGDNVIHADGIARIQESDAQRLGKYRMRKGDIVYSRRGDVEKRALVLDAHEGWLCGTGCLRVRLGDNSKHDPAFISYLLGTEESRAWIVRHAVGATMPNLNTSILSAVPLEVPEPFEQRAIAEVLGTVDDKIAANAKLISTADQLSHAIFRSISQSSGHVVPLSETAEFVNGKAFTKDASGTGRVVIRIAELNSGIGSSTVYNDIDVDDRHLARQGDLLFAWSGSLTLHRWFRPEGIVNQHIFKVIPKVGYPRWLVHELLRHKLEEFKSIAADKATTMGHIQRKHLDENVAVPTVDQIHKQNDSMTNLWERALAAEVECLQLAAARDALLPQLMSGKLRVRDAEKMLEDAGV